MSSGPRYSSLYLSLIPPQIHRAKTFSTFKPPSSSPELAALPSTHQSQLQLANNNHVPLRCRRNPLHRHLSPRLRQSHLHQSRLPLYILRLQHAASQSQRSNPSTPDRPKERQRPTGGDTSGESCQTPTGEVTREGSANDNMGQSGGKG